MFRINPFVCFFFIFSICLIIPVAAVNYPLIKHPIIVKFAAIKIPEYVVRMAVVNAVDNAVLIEPGSVYRIKDQAVPSLDFTTKLQVKFQLPILMEKNGKVASRIVVDVIAKYQAENFPDKVDRLFISNNPEEVNHSGLLFTGMLNKEKSAVLLYYHKNISDQNQDMLLRISNKDRKPAQVYLVPGTGGPSDDGVFVGHLATKRFFSFLHDKAGIFVTIPSGTSRVVYRSVAKSNQVIAGVFKIVKLSGGSLVFDTLMVDAAAEAVADQLFFEKEEKGHVGGIFPGGYKHIKKKYIISNDIMNIRVGDSPFLFDELSRNELQGNYGQMHKLDIELVNNYSEQKKVHVYFVPSGGSARGVFLLDNTVLETGFINPADGNELSTITAVSVNANSTKKILLVTMPQPGSFYPVNIVFKTEE